MSNEHNPIAQIISQLQNKWIVEISSFKDLNLGRWLIKPEHSKIYEGFLKLESSEKGILPEMLLVLFTPFEDIQLHSKHIIQEIINSYQGSQELINNYKAIHPNFNFDVDDFKKKLSNKAIPNTSLLLEVLHSFQKVLPNNRPFTLCLFPRAISDVKSYSKWLHTLLKETFPNSIKFMIFDHAQERYFDQLCKMHESVTKSLAVPIDLQGTINKLASAGNPNDPVVQFRKCMLKMSKSVEQKDLTTLKKWGEKGLEITQRTGQKSTYSSAHIIYAAMLFNFKAFDTIDNLLLKGLALAKQGLKSGDDTCKALIIQYYGFQASSKQLQKKYEEATNLFCKQADTAIDIGFPQQSINAWWMAYNAIKKKDNKRYKALVEQAYKHGIGQDKETLKSTTMSFIAADYYAILEKEHKESDCIDIDTFMLDIEGEHWRDNVESQRKAMEKRKFSFSNLF